MPLSKTQNESLDEKMSCIKMLYGHVTTSEFLAALRSSLGAAVVVLALMVHGCATQPLIGNDFEIYSMPYSYADGLGVGSGPVEDILVLPEGSEVDVASRAIVMALQELEFSIIEPNLSVGERLPEEKQWISDRVPVDDAWISDHNDAHPEMILPPRLYQIQYFGEYLVDRRQLIFKISARMFERALATDWREYKLPYSGTFFVNPLGQLIQDKLRAAAEETIQ